VSFAGNFPVLVTLLGEQLLRKNFKRQDWMETQSPGR
jgi:hypothetical protein